MDVRKPKKSTNRLDKNPYDRREEMITEKSFKSVDRSVKPVAKDTNKTRRKTTEKRIIGETIATVKPKSDLKMVLKKCIKNRC